MSVSTKDMSEDGSARFNEYRNELKYRWLPINAHQHRKQIICHTSWRCNLIKGLNGKVKKSASFSFNLNFSFLLLFIRAYVMKFTQTHKPVYASAVCCYRFGLNVWISYICSLYAWNFMENLCHANNKNSFFPIIRDFWLKLFISTSGMIN